MNPQFKKGVLELIVLLSVTKRDMYGYELVDEVSKIVDVNEGTIYPLLKRLTNEHYFETYLKESNEGPPRKYYHLTAGGILYMKKLDIEWEDFSKRINDFVREHRSHEEG
ncbi:MAG: PadR family transcriptional regulator [Oscillospiraceae bacterium]